MTNGLDSLDYGGRLTARRLYDLDFDDLCVLHLFSAVHVMTVPVTVVRYQGAEYSISAKTKVIKSFKISTEGLNTIRIEKITESIKRAVESELLAYIDEMRNLGFKIVMFCPYGVDFSRCDDDEFTYDIRLKYSQLFEDGVTKQICEVPDVCNRRGNDKAFGWRENVNVEEMIKQLVDKKNGAVS